jgi:hypothetical protein
MIVINQFFRNIEKYSNKENAYYIVLPSHLILQSFKIMCKFSNIFYNTPIQAYFKMGSNIKNTSDLVSGNFINIISDEILKEYTINRIKPNKDDMGISNKPVDYDTTNPQEIIFHPYNIFIYDEIDTLVDPFKSDLNIPNSPYIHPANAKIIDTLFDIIDEYYFDVSDNYDIKTNNVLLNLPKVTEYDNIFFEKIQFTLFTIKNMYYNQNFGFGSEDHYDYFAIANDKENIFKHLFIAIPYKANNSPVNGSEFSDFELAVGLTILSYYNMSLRPIDLFIYLNDIMNIYVNSRDLVEIIYRDFIDTIGMHYIDKYFLCNIDQRFNLCIELSKNTDIVSPDNEGFFKEYVKFKSY